jgi:hypothetical protein
MIKLLALEPIIFGRCSPFRSRKASAYVGQGDHKRHHFRRLKSEGEVKRLGIIRDCVHENAADANRIGGMYDPRLRRRGPAHGRGLRP